MTASELLKEIRGRGVTVDVDGDKLRLAPGNALDKQLVEELRQHKVEVIAQLEEEEADRLVTELRSTMLAGEIPHGWDKVLHCTECGDVPWNVSGTVEMCPWCWIRRDGRPVPEANQSSPAVQGLQQADGRVSGCDPCT